MKATQSGTRRYPELDGCRGIAIVMMVIFHLVFDLSFFSIASVTVSTGFWRYFGYTTAALFILIAGTAVSIRKTRSKGQNTWIQHSAPFFRRGVSILMVGMGVSFATWIFLKGNGYVLFGILHLIGTATILAPFFFRADKLAIIPGFLLVLAGWTVPLPEGPLWLAGLGIHPIGFYSVDYTPLIPWFGVFLIGMGMGAWLYPKGERSFSLSPRLEHLCEIPAIPGRHSLMIYVIHQPVLVGLLMVLAGRIS